MTTFPSTQQKIMDFLATGNKSTSELPRLVYGEGGANTHNGNICRACRILEKYGFIELVSEGVYRGANRHSAIYGLKRD